MHQYSLNKPLQSSDGIINQVHLKCIWTCIIDKKFIKKRDIVFARVRTGDPSACEADVITTTLRKLRWHLTASISINVLPGSWSGIIDKKPLENDLFPPGFEPGNRGPSACEADVITTTLRKLRWMIRTGDLLCQSENSDQCTSRFLVLYYKQETIKKRDMFSPGFEPGTFCVWSRRDNHYTTKTQMTLDCSIRINVSLGSWSGIIDKKPLEKDLFPPGFEPGTFCVWSRRDNHYTTKTQMTLDCSIDKNQNQCISRFLVWYYRQKTIRKRTCFRPGSNRGPSACEADVITTTLRKLRWHLTAQSESIYFLGSWSGIIDKKPLEKGTLFSPGFEPGTFCVWSRRDNHYTTKTQMTLDCSNRINVFLGSWSGIIDNKPLEKGLVSARVRTGDLLRVKQTW